MGLFDFFKNKKTNSDNSSEENKFDENEIENLVREIETVQFKEFWYGSKLLEMATHFKDERITRALTMRHYFLENKKAGSCYVLRHTIKTLEAPYFNTLWDMLQSGNTDQSNAASFILSEIGGLWTFQKAINLLRNKGQETYQYLVPCIINLIARYYEIQNEAEPTMEVMDVKTEQLETVAMKSFAPDIYERTMQDRKLSNELFKFTTPDRIDEMILLLKKVPIDFFQDIDREKLYTAIDNLKVPTT
jgi:hypothetical protein